MSADGVAALVPPSGRPGCAAEPPRNPDAAVSNIMPAVAAAGMDLLRRAAAHPQGLA